MRTLKIVCRYVTALILASACQWAFAAEADNPCESSKGYHDRSEALRACLNPGYSLLYQEADGLPKMHWLLMFKRETKEVDDLVTQTLDYDRKLASQLESLAHAHPDVAIKLDPMPSIIGQAREQQGQDRFREFRPLVGKSGTPFERDLLLTLANAIDEQRHLARLMSQKETNDELKRFLSNVANEFDRLQARYSDLLESRYFAVGAKAPIK